MGIFSTILGSIVKSSTKIVLDLLADNPVLRKLTEELDKSIGKLKKSIKEAKKSRDKTGGSNIGDPLRKLGKQIDEKYGGKY